MNVIQCESGEAASLVLEKLGGCLSLMITDVGLAGAMNGIQLADLARKRFPNLAVTIVSATVPPSLPAGTAFLLKPYAARAVIEAAEESRHSPVGRLH
jgi:hypothetical protein